MDVTAKYELIGLMAYPIRHSLSPEMQNKALEKAGLPFTYMAFEVDNSTFAKEGANKQVISSQADSLIKISRIWADF
ncbi:hypothetical protein QU896_00005, partial [Citrobacter freundii]